MIELAKNSRECVRIENTEYQGFLLVSIRVFWREGANEQWKPSKKGLSVRRDMVPGLIQALGDVLTEEMDP